MSTKALTWIYFVIFLLLFVVVSALFSGWLNSHDLEMTHGGKVTYDFGCFGLGILLMWVSGKLSGEYRS